MIIYLPALSVLATLLIFRSQGIDYRAVAFGSLIPFLIDLFNGELSYGHSFILPCVLLVIIMLATIKQKRLLRRRLLCFIIGMFFALVLEGTFRFSTIWFLPIKSGAQEHIALLPSLTVILIRDAIGLIATWIIFGLGELYKRENFTKFRKTGRIIFDANNIEIK